MRKRGSEQYLEIVVSLILGLLILTIGLYWIFQEYFSEDEIDWEVCRQSVLLRASLPEKDLALLETDLKGAYPLKCKTEVIEIDSIESNEVYGKVAEAVVEGWYMFGEGKLDFVHRNFLKDQRYCMVFARVHFTPDSVKKFDDALGKSSYPDSDKIQFGLGFYNYYTKTKIPGQSGTYNQYLPMLGSDEPSPRFVWNSEVYPKDDDILLVYVMNKYASISRPFSYIPIVWITSAIMTGESLDSLLNKLEGANVIDMVSAKDLGKIGCTKFLTIPA